MVGQLYFFLFLSKGRFASLPCHDGAVFLRRLRRRQLEGGDAQSVLDIAVAIVVVRKEETLQCSCVELLRVTTVGLGLGKRGNDEGGHDPYGQLLLAWPCYSARRTGRRHHLFTNQYMLWSTNASIIICLARSA